MCVHVSVSTSVSACVCKHSLSAYYFAQSQPKPTWQLQHSSTLAVDSSSANFECACVQPSSLETCDDECDDMEEEDFHPCGLTRRGMQQDLEEKAAVATKEVLQIACIPGRSREYYR